LYLNASRVIFSARSASSSTFNLAALIRLTRANLMSANLMFENLFAAGLCDAFMSCANLSVAMLEGVDLTTSILTGATLPE